MLRFNVYSNVCYLVSIKYVSVLYTLHFDQVGTQNNKSNKQASKYVKAIGGEDDSRGQKWLY